MTVLNRTKKILHTTFSVGRALRFVWAGSRLWSLLNVFLLLVQGILPVVSIYLLKLLVDTVVANTGLSSDSVDPHNVYTILALVGGVILINGLARNLGILVNREQSRRVADYMHDVIQRKAVEVDLEFYENPSYQDSLHRAQEEALFRPGIIVQALASILRNGISLVGVAWLLLFFKWPVLLLLLGAALPELIVRFVFSSREYLRERSYTKKEREASYYHWLLVGPENAKEVRLYELGETFIQRFRRIRSDLRAIRFGLDKKSALYSSLAHIFSTLLVFSAYFWVAREALLGLVTIGSFVMFYQAFQRGQGFLQSLLGGIASLYENNLFLTNLYEFLDITNRITFPPGEDTATSASGCRVVFENVHFSYPHGQRKVLNGVSLTIEPGEVAALVGINGSGKTTLVKLLCRLYDVDHGMISVNGCELRGYDPSALRRRIGVIFQDYPHYNLSVRDNIRFGDVGLPADSGEIVRAAEKAGAHDFIETLSSGYDTVLGRMFENGEELSEGQWQKIALSRAFFRDTEMIILDEPTSSMDPKAEYELFNGFRKILDRRSALLISHRMSTVRMADRIFVLDDGRIAESGTHDELMAAGGIYADLFETQSRNYLSHDKIGGL